MKEIKFKGHSDELLSARLDVPSGKINSYAIFAHCFTCSKDLYAADKVSQKLAKYGIGVLRFDFTGLGKSEGEFGNTNFSSNVEDLIKAQEFLNSNYQPATLMVGHSLGGAATLAAATKLNDIKAVVTIGAPSNVANIQRHFSDVDIIKEKGEAEIKIAGRKFNVKKQFLDDIDHTKLLEIIKKLNKPVLIMHSPIDEIVGIENAKNLYDALSHPKSFISLDKADHLITKTKDADYISSIIAAWSSNYLDKSNGQF